MFKDRVNNRTGNGHESQYHKVEETKGRDLVDLSQGRHDKRTLGGSSASQPYSAYFSCHQNS
jgi:hypothetical protein